MVFIRWEQKAVGLPIFAYMLVINFDEVEAEFGGIALSDI
jgi:hypothetical protein